MQEEKTGFIYIWYDRKRKMYYIGCHLGSEDDGYICSSRRMRDVYRRRPQDFKRRVLKRNVLRKDLLTEEHKWLQLISDEELGKKYYNVSNHHFGHWITTKDKSGKNHPMFGRKQTQEAREKMSKNRVWTEEQKQHLREKALLQFSNPENRKKAGEKNKGKIPWIKGKNHSDEAKQKMSIAAKNHSKESIEKMRKSLTGKKHSEETKEKMRGKRGPQKNPRNKNILLNGL